ncbi:hypothetical protein CPB83DRAFT_838143 [Crepidotus variabilis]|uniref:Uncharacterized protein n=1 Tax=Crepidotus variabilis TaxID=179855 RepID=A0A9P6JM80_9AGAR|nr:hypothetical protein CPB83DRAFT_838143 [Crepidotus variabilis]
MPARSIIRRQLTNRFELPQPVVPGNLIPPPNTAINDAFSNTGSDNQSSSLSSDTTTSSPASMDGTAAKIRSDILNPYSQAALFDGPLTPMKTEKRWTMPSPSRFDEEIGIDDNYMGPRSRGYKVRSRRSGGIVKAKLAEPTHTASHWIMGPDRLIKVAVWKESSVLKERKDVVGEEMEVLKKRKVKENDSLVQFEEHDTDVDEVTEMDLDGIDKAESSMPAQLGPKDAFIIDPQEEERIRLANQIEAEYPEKWMKAKTGILRAYTTEIIE